MIDLHEPDLHGEPDAGARQLVPFSELDDKSALVHFDREGGAVFAFTGILAYLEAARRGPPVPAGRVRRPGKKPARRLSCGSWQGYNEHLDHGEDPCRWCLEGRRPHE